MATDDIQRRVAGTEAAPAHFKIPGNGQIRPKVIYASYDGSGAGGDFLPALKIVSDAGEPVGTFPTATKVVAGASADVTWFPGVEAAAAGAGGAAAYAELRRSLHDFADPAWTVPAGNSNFVPFPHQTISNAAVFAMGTVTNPDDTLDLLAPGLYLFQAWTLWEIADFVRYAILDANTPVTFSPPNTDANVFSAHDPFGVGDTWTYDSQGGSYAPPANQPLRCFNGDGVDRVVNEAGLMAYYWPTS